MIIEEKDFKLEFDEGCKRFDFYLLHVVNAKNPEKRREEFKLEGYSMLLESIIPRVINYRLNKKLDVVTLKEYLSEYKKEFDEFKQTLKSLNLL